MNLEQIVKETVAKFVAEKQGKDLTGDGKIDSADYLQARSNAIEKAKGLDEDYEVAMAQDSLDSIIHWIILYIGLYNPLNPKIHSIQRSIGSYYL